LFQTPDQFFQRGVLLDSGKGAQVSLGRLAGNLRPAYAPKSLSKTWFAQR
jgi:hypothetical protein